MEDGALEPPKELTSESPQRRSLPIVGLAVKAPLIFNDSGSGKYKTPRNARRVHRSREFSAVSCSSVREFTLPAQYSEKRMRRDDSVITSDSAMPALSIRMVAKVKMWKNRAVMNVQLRKMATVKQHHMNFKTKHGRRLLAMQTARAPLTGRRGIATARPAVEKNVEVLKRALEPLSNEVEQIGERQENMEERLQQVEHMLGFMAAIGNQSKAHMDVIKSFVASLSKKQNSEETPIEIFQFTKMTGANSCESYPTALDPYINSCDSCSSLVPI